MTESKPIRTGVGEYDVIGDFKSPPVAVQKIMTLNELADKHICDAWDYGEDYSSKSFKAGWHESLDWVIGKLIKDGVNHFSSVDVLKLAQWLNDEHKKEVGE